MPIPLREQRLLFAKSGNRCAFPDCGKLLVVDSDGKPVLLGEMAHIVGERPDGPRGQSELGIDDRNREPNLVVLCNVHHQLVDDQPSFYSVQRLIGFKQEHEERVRDGRLPPADDPIGWSAPDRTDAVYSTLLPVESMPTQVFAAAIGEANERDIRAKVWSDDSNEALPFIVRAGQLLAFHDLSDPNSPFSAIVADAQPARHRVADWVGDPDRFRWVVELLNRAVSRWTAQRGLRFDRDHHRYYFAPLKAGEARTVTYRPLNQKRSKRKVVWQPERKATGEARPYWLHMAVSLRFLNTSPGSWCLAVRPGLRVTTDGETPPASDLIGRRVTRRMNRMFNYELLGQVQFWRDYLANSQPRIIVRFGSQATKGAQSLIISNAFTESRVTWPGLPAEFDKPFTNIRYEDDLFSWADLQAALSDQAASEDYPEDQVDPDD